MRGFARAVRYSHHMPDWVRDHTTAGLTSNDEIADVLRQRFDNRITPSDVARWRRQEGKFERACAGAMNDFQAECIGVIKQAVRGGDVAAAKWYLERTSERFKPSSKVDMNSQVGSLDERLRKRQLSDDELAERGVLVQRETRDIREYGEDEFYSD